MRYINQPKRPANLHRPPTDYTRPSAPSSGAASGQLKSKFGTLAEHRSGYRAKIYATIIDYCAEHGGNAPTIREIMQRTGISSTSVVAYHIHSLIGVGKLDIVDRKLCVVGATWIAPKEENNGRSTD